MKLECQSYEVLQFSQILITEANLIYLVNRVRIVNEKMNNSDLPISAWMW